MSLYFSLATSLHVRHTNDLGAHGRNVGYLGGQLRWLLPQWSSEGTGIRDRPIRRSWIFDSQPTQKEFIILIPDEPDIGELESTRPQGRQQVQ